MNHIKANKNNVTKLNQLNFSQFNAKDPMALLMMTAEHWAQDEE